MKIEEKSAYWVLLTYCPTEGAVWAYHENSLYMTKFPYLSILEPLPNEIWLANLYLLEPFTIFQLEVDDPVLAE